MIINLTSENFEVGSFDSHGVDYQRTDRIRAENIPVNLYNVTVNISLNVSKTVQFVIASFDGNGNFLYHSGNNGWTSNGGTVRLPTGSAVMKIVLRFSDDSTFTPDKISSCDVSENGWIIDEHGKIINTAAPSVPENAMIKPYPTRLWRIERLKNNGFPFHERLPNVSNIGSDVWSLKRKNIIKVFDMHEPQEGFKSNGLAILDPSACESWHDDDRWDIELTHPMDNWGKWKNLLCDNVLLVDGQLFRIDRYDPKISSSEHSVTVHARHITEDMAGQLIWESSFEGGTATDFMNFAFNNTVDPWLPEQGIQHYHFTANTDINVESGADEYNNVSLWAAMVGADNSFMHKYGGELYRNNFYFSLNSRMENAKDNAFNLNYRLDMVEIEQIIDFSDFATELWTKDNWGNYWRMYWGGLECDVHHPRIRGAVFNYPEFEGSAERLDHDSTALWETMDFPKVSYKVKMANIRKDPRYADFLRLQELSYGDTGTITCAELDISTTQKIVSVHRNELTGEIIDMTLGNIQESWVRPSFMSNTVSSGNSLSDKQFDLLQNEVDKNTLKMLSDWNGAKKFTWSELRKFKWGEVKNGYRDN